MIVERCHKFADRRLIIVEAVRVEKHVSASKAPNTSHCVPILKDDHESILRLLNS